MEESTALAIRELIEPMFNTHTGNIWLIVGSSQCGKSTFLANVLLPILCLSKGWITTFMSPSYDSIPIQELILKQIASSKKSESSKGKGSDGNPTGFKLNDLYETGEWLFTKRGYDENYCKMIYNMRLLLYKNYGEADKVREFRFVLCLDDEIDINGGLIREVCLTWRNKGITWIQLCQDITNFDCSVRNSAPVVMFGRMNFPARIKKICEEYLNAYLPGANIHEKISFYQQLTENKDFILMNNQLNECWHIDTHTGVCTQLPKLATTEDMNASFYELQATMGVKGEGKKKEEKGNKSKQDISRSKSAPPVGSSKRKTRDAGLNVGGSTEPHVKRRRK